MPNKSDSRRQQTQHAHPQARRWRGRGLFWKAVHGLSSSCIVPSDHGDRDGGAAGCLVAGGRGDISAPLVARGAAGHRGRIADGQCGVTIKLGNTGVPSRPDLCAQCRRW